jgi:hypothetical protein
MLWLSEYTIFMLWLSEYTIFMLWLSECTIFMLWLSEYTIFMFFWVAEYENDSKINWLALVFEIIPL